MKAESKPNQTGNKISDIDVFEDPNNRPRSDSRGW